jgi:hypothetical protein
MRYWKGVIYIYIYINSVAINPQAKYTDRTFAATLLRVESFAWLAQQIPTAVNVGFLDRSHFWMCTEAAYVQSSV